MYCSQQHTLSFVVTELEWKLAEVGAIESDLEENPKKDIINMMTLSMQNISVHENTDTKSSDVLKPWITWGWESTHVAFYCFWKSETIKKGFCSARVFFVLIFRRKLTLQMTALLISGTPRDGSRGHWEPAFLFTNGSHGRGKGGGRWHLGCNPYFIPLFCLSELHAWLL